MAETSISGIEFSIVGTTTRARSSVDKLVTSLKGLKSALGSASTAKMSKELDDLDKHAKKSTTTLGKLFKSIGRIAFYRTIRAALRFITDGFKEGLQNAYQFSKMVGYELAGTMDNLATKSLTMKNQLGSAFGGLIQTLEPILIQIISLVTKAANALAQLFAIIGGRKTYLKAVDTMTQFGEAVGGAGQAAKEAMRYLAPFDELNVLPADNAGGGGGGGASTPDYSSMFEVTDVEEDSILGSLASMFNNMSDWFEEQDWKSLGASVWKGLKASFSDEGKADDLVRALFRTIGAVTGATAGFVWGFVSEAVESIMQSFKDSIRDYNGDNKIGITDILTGIWNFAISPFVWIDENIVKPFWRGFTGALLGEEQEPITVGEFFSWAFRALTDNAITRWIKDNVITPIKNAFSSPFSNDDDNPGKSLGDTILDGIAKPFKAVGAWVKEHIIDPIKEALKGFSISKLLFGDGEEGTDSGDVSGETTIDIKAKLTKVGEWSQDVVDVVKEKGGEVKKTVKAIVDKAQGWVKEAGDALLSPDSTTKTVLTAVDKAKSWLKEAADIVLSPNAITKTVSTAVDKAKSWVKEAADVVLAPNAVTKTVSTALDKAKTWVADAWTAITQPSAKSTTVTASVKKGTWVKDAWAATKLKASSITKKVTSTVNKGKTFVQDAFTAAKMKASSIIRSVASAVSKGSWDGEAYKVSTLTTGKVTRDVTANAKKGSINQNAYNVLTARGGYVDMYANITSLTNGLGYDPSLSATAYFDSYSDGFYDRPSIDVDANIVGLTGSDNIWPGAAKGGILSGGIWRNIPQYASGTSRAHGSLFVAGEAGPEVVGHIGGRTEVLNRSQLAATMYAAVSRAIMGVRFNINAINAPSATSDSYDEDAMYRAMLRALNDSDAFPDEIDLDGDVVYRKMVKRNQMNTRMTGRNAMATA